jgi:hypothetical protein
LQSVCGAEFTGWRDIEEAMEMARTEKEIERALTEANVGNA